MRHQYGRLLLITIGYNHSSHLDVATLKCVRIAVVYIKCNRLKSHLIAKCKYATLWFVLHVTFLLGERSVVFLATMHALGVRVVGKRFLHVLGQLTFQSLIEKTGVRGHVLNIESLYFNCSLR